MGKAEDIARASKFYEPYTMTATTAELDKAVDRLLDEPVAQWWSNRMNDLFARKDLSPEILTRLWNAISATQWAEFYGNLIVLHRGADAPLLALIADETNYEWTLRKIAFNPNTSGETLRKLLKEGNLNVRVGLAKNPSAPFDVLEVLALEKSTQIQNALKKNPAWVKS